jgi:hypothetical protein
MKKINKFMIVLLLIGIIFLAIGYLTGEVNNIYFWAF